ncbi:MAG: PilT/PilU family type 4a pilus ATPase [Planctomycetota bacterium]|nr:PilT/PilU family type 4a pilus ATPase [Planctomycetota bacterium]MDI6787785.1 PilT/PilU family type 4a pilus ATPase [Planctomycetota bacterium]
MEKQLLDIKGLFAQVVARNASDLFIKVGAPPTIRVVGKLEHLPVAGGEQNNLTPEMVEHLFLEVTTERLRQKFIEQGEIDTAYEIFGMGRFRINIFRQKGFVGMVARYIRAVIPSLEETGLPLKPLQKLTQLSRGLILVTGIAGSGKSTTIASLLNYINKNYRKHIVTVEDPIEYLFIDDKSLVNQRELGIDTFSFPLALKHAVRQSPDIIMIGEMRDRETMEAALAAAETGHLVISTLHSINSFQTVERIINFFPPHQHQLLRQQLSLLLQGVVSQRLVARTDGKGFVPAAEIMLPTPTIKDMLYEGKTRDLYDAIKESHAYYGTQTFNQSLRGLYQNNLISLEDALSYADRPDELKLELRGITRGDAADFSFK